MTYAIVKLGGKQYRVQEGEKLLVDRLPVDENKAFHPEVLFVGGDGAAELAPKGVQVTAKVVGHVLGDKIRIGKYKKRTGYRLHNGYRSRLTQIEIETIGAGGRKTAAKKETPKAEAPKVEAPKVEAPKAEAPTKVEAAAAAEAPARTAHPPKGYEDMTVAQISEAAHGWRRPNLEAALEYEREHANRKGAIAALESAIASKEEGS